MIINIVMAPFNLPDSVPFYCIRCRTQLFRANRDILALWMGEGYPPLEIPRGMGWEQRKCHSCKTVWNFYWQ